MLALNKAQSLKLKIRLGEEFNTNLNKVLNEC